MKNKPIFRCCPFPHPIQILTFFSLFFLAGCATSTALPIATEASAPTSESAPTATQDMVTIPTDTPQPKLTPEDTPTQPPTGTPTATQTATLTFTPTITLTATVPPPLAVTELELLRIPPPIFRMIACPGAEASDEPQQVVMRPPDTSLVRQINTLCLLGFPLDEKVTVSLIDPDGKVVTETVYRVVETLPALFGSKPKTVVRIPFDPNLAYRHGEWKIIARSASADISARIPIEECLPPTNLRQVPYNVTVQPRRSRVPKNMLDAAGFEPYRVGDQLEVHGACYPANTSLTIGVYRPLGSPSMKFELVWSGAVNTGQNGEFTQVVPLTDSLLRDGTGGTYIVLPLTNEMSATLAGQQVHLASLSFAGFELLPLPAQSDCYRAARLRLGDQARLPSRAAAVFSASTLRDISKISAIPAGSRVEVIDGPICYEGKVSYYVHDPDSGIAGWVNQTTLQP